jgi:hypothetical protein
LDQLKALFYIPRRHPRHLARMGTPRVSIPGDGKERS